WTTVSTTVRQADGYTIAVWSDSHSTVTVDLGIGRAGEEASRGENVVPPRRFTERRQGRAKTFQVPGPIHAGTQVPAQMGSSQSQSNSGLRGHRALRRDEAGLDTRPAIPGSPQTVGTAVEFLPQRKVIARDPCLGTVSPVRREE